MGSDYVIYIRLWTIIYNTTLIWYNGWESDHVRVSGYLWLEWGLELPLEALCFRDELRCLDECFSVFPPGCFSADFAVFDRLDFCSPDSCCGWCVVDLCSRWSRALVAVASPWPGLTRCNTVSVGLALGGAGWAGECCRLLWVLDSSGITFDLQTTKLNNYFIFVWLKYH